MSAFIDVTAAIVRAFLLGLEFMLFAGGVFSLFAGIPRVESIRTTTDPMMFRFGRFALCGLLVCVFFGAALPAGWSWYLVGVMGVAAAVAILALLAGIVGGRIHL